MGAQTRAGLALTGNVLGVGALFLPWTAYAAFGAAVGLGWAYAALACCLLVLALALAAAGSAGWTGAAGFVGRAFGTPWERAVQACYAVGVTAGQVVVALVAAGFLAQATGGRAGWWMALVGLAVAVVATATDRQVPARLSRPIFLGVLVLLAATIACARAGASRPPAAHLDPGLLASAAVFQLFAVVGVESTPGAVLAAGARGRRGPVWAFALVALVYAAALLAAAHSGAWTVTPGLVLPLLDSGVARVLACCLALLVGVCCARNVATASRLAVEALTGAPASAGHRRLAALAVGAAAALGVVSLARGWLRAADVLSVPNAMALLVFLAMAASALVLGGGRARGWACAALGAFLPLPFFAGPAFVASSLVAGTAVAWTAVRTARSRPDRSSSTARAGARRPRFVDRFEEMGGSR